MGFPLGFSGSTVAEYADVRHALAAVAHEIQRLKGNVEWRSESEFSFHIPMFRFTGSRTDALATLSGGRVWLEAGSGSEVRLGYDVSYLRTAVIIGFHLVVILLILAALGWSAEDIGWFAALVLVWVLLGNYVIARSMWPRFIRKAARVGLKV